MYTISKSKSIYLSCYVYSIPKFSTQCFILYAILGILHIQYKIEYRFSDTAYLCSTKYHTTSKYSIQFHKQLPK